jgi:peptidyl-prolyl cis-trans isomerase B (cyclophilin B)
MSLRLNLATGWLVWCLASGSVWAQVTPARMYHPLRTPIAMSVTLPEDAVGQPMLDLYAGASDRPTASEPVAPGEADLGVLFPSLRQPAEPKVHFVQLRVGDRKVGAPVVLQPMIPPARAALDERQPRLPLVVWPASRQPKRVFSGWRAYVSQDVVLETDAGKVTIRLRPDAAPNTAWTFRTLVADGFYDGLTFHRTVATGPVAGEPFLVQAGDPSGAGEGGPGFEIPLENSPLKHDYGVVSLARQPREVNSGGSQFFIALSRREAAALDGQYAAFGEVTSGMDVVLKIARAPVESGSSERPLKPVRIVTARLVDAAPMGEGEPAQRMEQGER